MWWNCVNVISKVEIIRSTYTHRQYTRNRYSLLVIQIMWSQSGWTPSVISYIQIGGAFLSECCCHTHHSRAHSTHTHEQQIGNRHIRCTDGIDNLPKAPSFQFKNIINEIIINWKSIINSWNCKCNDKARSTCLCTSTRARAAHSAHSKGALTKAWLHHHLIVNRKRTQAHFYVWQYINEIELKAKKKNSRKK